MSSYEAISKKSMLTGSQATTHISVRYDQKSQESQRIQVNYSAAPIIYIIGCIVVVFVMSLITGVGV